MIIGGTLYAAGKFPFLACSESINKATDPTKAYPVLKRVNCYAKLVLYTGYIVLIVGAIIDVVNSGFERPEVSDVLV